MVEWEWPCLQLIEDCRLVCAFHRKFWGDSAEASNWEDCAGSSNWEDCAESSNWGDIEEASNWMLCSNCQIYWTWLDSNWLYSLCLDGVVSSSWNGSNWLVTVSCGDVDSSNTVPGRSLEVSGARGFQGKNPARLNPLEIKSGFKRQSSVAWCNKATIEYLLRLRPVFDGLHCQSQANFLSCFFSEENRVRSQG